MDIVLIAGLWLDGSAWDDVVAHLRELGHDPIAVTLPGQGDGTSEATLDEQLAAVTEIIDDLPDPVMVVGHSAACSLAWLVADRRAGQVARVVLVDGVPQADGDAYAPWFELVDGAAPFPGWEPFAGPAIDDLDEPTRNRLAETAHPMPEGVVNGIVRYTDPARKSVPITLLATAESQEQGGAAIEAGHVPELAGVSLDVVTLPGGHWPMVSRPEWLAETLAGLAD